MTADPNIKIAQYEDKSYVFYSHQPEKDFDISLQYKNLSIIHNIIQRDNIYNRPFSVKITKFHYNNIVYDVAEKECYDPTPNSTLEEIHALLDTRHQKNAEKNKYIF